MVSCSDELAIHSCPLHCLQRQIANGLFHCWSLQYCVTITWQQIFKCSLRVTVAGVLLACMGGGTFFKVGGHKCTLKKIIANFVVWIGNCDVRRIEIWRHYLYILWRSKLHYFRQNYTIMKTYRWATSNSNRLLQGQPRSLASLVMVTSSLLRCRTSQSNDNASKSCAY